MKKILIITTRKKLFICIVLCLIITIMVVLSCNLLRSTKHLQTFTNNTDIQELEKENTTLKNLLSSMMPKDKKVILEDEYRNIYKHAHAIPPPPLTTSPLNVIAVQGTEVKYRILLDEPRYIRPVYDPSWKGFYFRGWLDLPYKNLEARHRIFAFSLGGSANFDIFGSLGFEPKSSPSAPIDNHHNINFLIYGFKVKNIKVYQNQVAFIGEPRETGAQVVSIVQNDLLPAGVDTKDFLFQLSTPKGYEIDFLYHNIIRYEYLMKQIQEHTVHPSFAAEDENNSIQKLLRENAAVRKELSFFIPDTDEAITQKTCSTQDTNQSNPVGVSHGIKHGKKVPFSYNYKNFKYKRPLYDPAWNINYRRKWNYIPKQIESNMHRLHIIPPSSKAQYDFFGKLGFHEKYQQLKAGQSSLLIYNFHVTNAVAYKDQLLLLGIPTRSGAEIISVNSFNTKVYQNYFVELVTPDNSIVDCQIMN